nr:hypothetical protein [Tanacetum cinerariifolium]
LEPDSHKENPKYVDEDDEEKVDEKKYDEMGSLEIRTEEMQTLISTTPRSPGNILSSDKNINQELTDNMKSNPQDQPNDPASWDVLKQKFEKSSTSNTSCKDDEFQSQRHDDHQEDDAPPKGEKRFKRQKTSKSLKSTRGSLSRRSVKDSIAYVSKK